MIENDITIRIGGEAGMGLESSGAGFAKALVRGGLHVFGVPDFYSRIRGGHNFFTLRVAHDPLFSIADPVHILFALDMDLENDFNRYTLKGEYMAAYNASKYYVLDHEYTEHIVKEIFGITPKINWEYSIEYVKFDMARINLTDAIEETKQMLIDNQDILSLVYTLAELQPGQDPLEYFAFETVFEGYEYIEDTLSEAQFNLELEDTELMNASIEALDELKEKIEGLIKVPPTPEPTPTVTPDVSPSPTP